MYLAAAEGSQFRPLVDFLESFLNEWEGSAVQAGHAAQVIVGLIGTRLQGQTLEEPSRLPDAKNLLQSVEIFVHQT